jgi:uncharacterized 2Fe-2S/4Fe-4S cluster protein (DUF4445 family)
MSGTNLFLDIGTNGEIILALNGRLLGCSTAAGPAFEGASIVQGMPALPGAIEAIELDGDRIECAVVGGGAPRGLCGTGLVSAVAALRRCGAIDPSGRLADANEGLSDRLEGEATSRRFRLATADDDVSLYQSDIREYQLAKAAVRAGIEILLQHAGVEPSAIDQVLVAGGFSQSLSPRDLVETGFLPPIAPECVRFVGNTAAAGARNVLMDRALLEAADRLAERVSYVELSGLADFDKLFIGSMQL